MTESLGVAGDKNITGLTTNKSYVVLQGTNFYGVLADGTLSTPQTTKAAAEALAVPLIGTEIIELTNGAKYKVEGSAALTARLISDLLGVAANEKVTGLALNITYKVGTMLSTLAVSQLTER